MRVRVRVRVRFRVRVRVRVRVRDRVMGGGADYFLRHHTPLFIEELAGQPYSALVNH